MGSGSFAASWLEKESATALGFLFGSPRAAVNGALTANDLSGADYSELVADELTFDLASELGIGNSNSANPETFNVSEGFLNGLSGAEAQQQVENTFGDINSLIKQSAGKDVLKDSKSAKKWFKENKNKLKDAYSKAQSKRQRSKEDEDEEGNN